MPPPPDTTHGEYADAAPARRPHLYRAAGVVDAAAVRACPGALLVQDGRVVAAGPPQAVTPPADAAIINLPDRVLLPALVNAHAHLDLSHIGPLARTGTFAEWANTVRQRRAVSDDAIAASVQHGAALARVGGTAFIGDIAGARSLAAVDALRVSPLRGVSFFETFGIGSRELRAIALLEQIASTVDHDRNGVRLGLQPHAPYSCGPSVYQAAARLGLPLSTHLAETREELEFVHSATGPLAEMLRAIGVWDDSISPHGCHPIDLLADVLASAPIIAAHLNYIDDAHIEQLAAWPVSVAYCPRASAYFGHGSSGDADPDPRPHRYHDMLDAGVNVCLGTDSLLCLDTADRISVLDEMRLLYKRDGTDAMLLLRMATINGARALDVDERSVTFAPGTTAGIISVAVDPTDSRDPLTQTLSNANAPEWISSRHGESRDPARDDA